MASSKPDDPAHPLADPLFGIREGVCEGSMCVVSPTAGRRVSSAHCSMRYAVSPRLPRAYSTGVHSFLVYEVCIAGLVSSCCFAVAARHDKAPAFRCSTSPLPPALHMPTDELLEQERNLRDGNPVKPACTHVPAADSPGLGSLWSW
jgi:hypothetical protein